MDATVREGGLDDRVSFLAALAAGRPDLFLPSAEENRLQRPWPPWGRRERVWTAKVGRDVVGVAWRHALTHEGVAYPLGDVVVAPRWRRRGVGAALAEAMLAGDPRLRPSVHEHWHPLGARRFAARLGYAAQPATGPMWVFRSSLRPVPENGARDVVPILTSSQFTAQAARLYELYCIGLRDLPVAEDAEPYRQWVKFWRAELAAGGSILTSRQASRPIGLILTYRCSRQHRYVVLTAVDPRHRDRGVGHALKVAAMQQAADAGDKWLWSAADPANAATLALNRRLGWRRVAQHALVNGDEV